MPPPTSPPDQNHGLFRSIRDAVVGTDHDYTEGKIGRAIMLLAIPMVLEMAMESLFALVNIFWVSHLGASAIASIGLTESMLALVYTVAIGFSMSGAAMVSRRIGEKDPKAASVAAAQILWLGLGSGALMGIGGAIFAPQLLGLMGASPEVVATGGSFARIMLGGQVVIILLFVLNGAFRGTGDAAIAMRSLWIANLVNLILDPLLIFGVGPFPELGLTGTAVGTTVGRGVGVAFQLWVLTSGRGRIHVTRETARPVWSVIVRLIRMSVGGMFQYLVATSSWIALTRIIATFGASAVAGYTVAIRVMFVALLPAWGLANAAATLVGQNLGAKRPERAAQAVKTAAIYNMGFIGAIALVFILATELVLKPFGADAQIMPTAVTCLRTLSYGFVFFGLGMVMVQGFNGAGDTNTPTLLNLITFWLIQIPLAYSLAITFQWGPSGVFWAVAISYSVSAVLGVAAFSRGTWKTRTV